MGDRTSKVGNPTGKDEGRVLLDDMVICWNTDGISQVFCMFLSFNNKEERTPRAPPDRLEGEHVIDGEVAAIVVDKFKAFEGQEPGVVVDHEGGGAWAVLHLVVHQTPGFLLNK